MPRRKPESESKEAQMSQERGKLAAGVPASERKSFVKEQGEGASDWETLVASTNKEKARQAVESAGVAERKEGTGVLRSYADGGVVESTGPAMSAPGTPETLTSVPAVRKATPVVIREHENT